jgi:hypothetical protein
VGTSVGQNGHQVFLNSELKSINNNNDPRKNRGHSMTIPLPGQPFGGTNVVKNINIASNLRSSGSPTNLTQISNNKLVRYKNGNTRNIPPPQNSYNSMDGSRGYNSNISKHQATSVEEKLNSKIDFVRKHAY